MSNLAILSGFDLDHPRIGAAHALVAHLKKGQPVDRDALLRTMTAAYGSSAADGIWTRRDAS